LASSGSYARGDEPRSVPDPDRLLHQAAARKQRAYNEAQEAELARKRAEAVQRAKYLGDRTFGLAESNPQAKIGHPNEWEALIPIWGPGREAIADAQDGDVLGAVGNGLLAASDLVPAKAVVGAVAKGAVKVGGSHVWRTKPWEKAQGVRQWMGEKGYLKPGEHGHHWAIPQGGWGRAVPDWVKNQPWNIHGTDAVTHGRIHGRYTVDGVKLPQFNPLERLRRGTPDWFQATSSSVAGRGVAAGGRRIEDRPGRR